MFDGQPYVRILDAMPEHPKVIGLSDGAFRTLITMWCYCSRNFTDGVVPAGIIATQKRASVDALEKAGLLEYRGGDYYCHDYLDHQRSASDIATAMATKNKNGSIGAHRRWHVNQASTTPKCPHCTGIPPDS